MCLKKYKRLTEKYITVSDKKVATTLNIVNSHSWKGYDSYTDTDKPLICIKNNTIQFYIKICVVTTLLNNGYVLFLYDNRYCSSCSIKPYFY